MLSNITYSQIILNEYSSSNYNLILDDNDEYEDWIEIKNIGSEPYNLNSIYLSDKIDNLTKFKINHDVIIMPNEFQLIYASGKNYISDNIIHTNFNLQQTKSNEWIVITDSDGISIIDSVLLKRTKVNHSRGRMNNLDWYLFIDPSPNEINSNNLIEYLDIPNFSIEPGNYDSEIFVTLLVDSNYQTFFTLDGSSPNQNSNLYTSPINILNTSVLKAMTISDNPNYYDSFIQYGTFFINDNFNLPVISISGQNVELMMNADTLNSIGALEYHINGNIIDKSIGEFNKHGNDSWNYPQRGFDFICRDQFGYNYSIKDQIFNNSNREKFQRLIIKAAANDNYPFSNGQFGAESGCHIRDAFVQSLSQVAKLNLDERSHQSCVLYLNGNYWGLYEIREKVDDIDYTKHYYSQDFNQVDYLKTWGGTWIEYGSDTGWYNLRDYILNNDMNNQNNYNNVKNQLNIMSIIDYFIINNFTVNSDWLNWNTSWWRGNHPSLNNIKWRYTLWDLDNTFNHGANYTGIVDQSFESNICDLDTLGDIGGQGHIPIWNKLMLNNNFFESYINRFSYLNDTYLSCDFLLNHLDSLINIIEPEMPAQILRWGGNIETWNQNVQELVNFISNRCNNINNNILNCYDDQLSNYHNITIISNIENNGEIYLNNNYISNLPSLNTCFENINQNIEIFPDLNFDIDTIFFVNNTPISNNFNSFNFELLFDDTLIINFKPLNSVNINTIPNDVGSISFNNSLINNLPIQYVLSGIIYLEANNLNNQYYFDYWLVNDSIIDQNNLSLFIEGNFDVTAFYSEQIEFSDIYFKIDPENSGYIYMDGNMIDVNQNFMLQENSNILLQSYPENGFKFKNWEYYFGSESSNTYLNYNIIQNDTIKAIFEIKELDVYIPNSFSPNGDNINDMFIPICDYNNVKYFEMYIYDKWGKLIFNSNNIYNGWDGSNSDILKNDYYSYIINITSKISNKILTYKGNIFLIH
tara:strand:- start:4228 stop:7161 length:2934 start_codon:yes stop_codon:yes gene_type:complete